MMDAGEHQPKYEGHLILNEGIAILESRAVPMYGHTPLTCTYHTCPHIVLTALESAFNSSVGGFRGLLCL